MGLAYLPDGTMVKYDEYIKSHPRWQKVRKARFDFDDKRCVVCHRDLTGEPYQTHHLSYLRLGRERLRDVVTMCDSCHHTFHRNWQKSNFWEGKEEGHWDIYDLRHTAKLCAYYWRQDRLISRNPNDINLCSRNVAMQIIDDYFRLFQLTTHPVIDPNDITLFVRNKRYELFFDAEKDGMTVEGFLDSYYGKKERGKNPLRQEAGRANGPFDHTPASFHRHYGENKNILILMEEVEKIERSTPELSAQLPEGVE